ncbi:sensor histidine kinase [Streptosporangium sp. CA-135522]|uniref:sensor histidine kinase n=1 Tax=Streptosporangium sp. CA-135522 TaxID=3240072 RepID=UPI003D8D4F16
MAFSRRDSLPLWLANAAPFACLLVIAAARISYLIGNNGLSTAGLLIGIALIVVLIASTAAVIGGWVPRRLASGLLVGQAVITFLPYAFIPRPWGPISGLLLYSMVALLPAGRRKWVLIALTVLGEPAIRIALSPADMVNILVGMVAFSANTGIWLFGLSRMRDLIRRAHAVREELVPLEVLGERLRAERDLRQALGADLSSIDLLSRGGAEPGEIVTVARRALAGARRVAEGFRSRTPRDELAAARSVLAAAGVAVQVRGMPPEGTDPSFGTALRLIVMALLAGQVSECRIEVDDTVRLRVSWTGEADLGRIRGLRLGPGPVAELWVPVRRRAEAEDAAKLEVPRHFAWRMLALMIACHLGMAYTNFAWQARNHPPSPSAAWLVGLSVITTLVAALTLYLTAPRPDEGVPRWWRWALGLQLALLVGIFLSAGPYAVLTLAANLIAGAVVLRLRPRWSAPIFTVLVLLPALSRAELATGVNAVYWATGTVDSALTIYAFNRMPVLTRRLQQARAELARLAVVRERLRVARDVHDLLGFHLSAIALKGELAEHLPADQRAAQLADVAGIAGRALADFRSITGEPAELALATEIEAARSLLEAAGVKVRTRVSVPVPPSADHLLATVLREAITNVVRHADAHVCEIELTAEGETVRLRVSNDGARQTREGGSGLANLASRAREAGGALQARAEGGWFSLSVTV